jgi:hypothetical protein
MSEWINTLQVTIPNQIDYWRKVSTMQAHGDVASAASIAIIATITMFLIYRVSQKLLRGARKV